MRQALRAAWALAVVPLLVTGVASPAAAHATGTYRTAVASVRPRVPGLRVTVTKDGNWVEVTNTGPAPVLVLGYEGEPYLRIGPSGSWRNSRSSTAALAEPTASDDLAGALSADATPHWVRLSTRRAVSFHDLRVPTTTTRRHVVSSSAPRILATWSLPLRAGDRPVIVRGNVRWYPTPVPMAWILSLSLLGVAMLALLGLAMRHENGRPRQRQERTDEQNRHKLMVSRAMPLGAAPTAATTSTPAPRRAPCAH